MCIINDSVVYKLNYYYITSSSPARLIIRQILEQMGLEINSVYILLCKVLETES